MVSSWFFWFISRYSFCIMVQVIGINDRCKLYNYTCFAAYSCFGRCLLVFKEKTRLSTILIIGISFVGVVLVAWGDFSLSKSAIIGDFLSFLCVIAVVTYLLIG